MVNKRESVSQGRRVEGSAKDDGKRRVSGSVRRLKGRRTGLKLDEKSLGEITIPGQRRQSG